MMYRNDFVLYLCLCVGTVSAATGNEFKFYLNGYDCFYEDIQTGTKCVVEFWPMDGNIDITVTDPNEVELYRKAEKSYGRFEFVTTETGTYSVCFSSIYELTVFKNRVYFNFEVEREGKLVRFPNSTAPKTMAENSVSNIHDAVKTVFIMLYYRRLHHTKAFIFTELVNKNVMYWSLMQCIVVVLVGVSQVYVLRRFFTPKSSVRI